MNKQLFLSADVYQWIKCTESYVSEPEAVRRLMLSAVFVCRLNLSPSPVQQSSIPRTHAQAVRRHWTRKRKHEGTSSGLSPSYKLSQHSSSRGSLSIDEIDPDGRFIKLKNNSDQVPHSSLSEHDHC